MSPKIVADECVDFRIIKELRLQGFDVLSVLESYRSIPDAEVLRLAKENQAVLLTEDSDFGEWIFSFKETSVGVIFLRYSPDVITSVIDSLVQVLKKYQATLLKKFTVISPKKIRIRAI